MLMRKFTFLTGVTTRTMASRVRTPSALGDEIIIMGADTVRMRLIAEIDKKSRISQMPTPASC
jgi:hypothetical protein